MISDKENRQEKVVYQAVIDGAKQGLGADALFAHVQAASPKAGSKTVVKQALLALSDSDIMEKAALDAIYDLAIRHRFAEASTEEVTEEAEAEAVAESQRKPAKKKKSKDKPGRDEA